MDQKLMTEMCNLAGVPMQESEGGTDTGSVIKALGDTDYRDKDAYFKMVQLLKGLAVASEKDATAKKFMDAVSDAMTSAAKKSIGESVELEEAKNKKAIKKEANAAFYQWFNGIEVDMFELGKLSGEIEKLISDGSDLEKEMPKLVKKYKAN